MPRSSNARARARTAGALAPFFAALALAAWPLRASPASAREIAIHHAPGSEAKVDQVPARLIMQPPLTTAAAPGYCPPQRAPFNCCELDSVSFVGAFRRSRESLQLRIRYNGQACPDCEEGPPYVVAWVDWNGDHLWEDSELAYAAAPFFGTWYDPNISEECEGDTVMTPIIRIPKTAARDSVWMRVGVYCRASAIKPCADDEIFGNTFDHKILLRDAAVVSVDVEGRTTSIQEAPNPIWQASLAYGNCDPVVGSSLPFGGGFHGPGPTLHVSLETCSGPMNFKPHVAYHWRVPDAFSAAPDTGSGSFDGWDGRIQLRLPAHVQKTQTLLSFDIEDDDHNVLRANQAVTLDTYVGYDVASGLPEMVDGKVKLQWLDRAVSWASGGSAPLDIARRLNSGIYSGGASLYRDVGTPWVGLVSMGGASTVGNCTTVSSLWAATARIVGIPSAADTLTRGAYGAGFVTRPGASASFDPGQTGNCGPEPSLTPDRWDFGMHQVGMLPISGARRFFDPTYGREYANFPQDLILWNLLSGFTSHAGKLAQQTDKGHIVYLVTKESASSPWGFWNFTPVSAPQFALRPDAVASLASFTGPGSWAPEDANGDGQYDALRWDGSVSVSASPGSTLAVTGGLFMDTLEVAERPSDASALPSSASIDASSPGTYSVALRFSGEEIRDSGAVGSLLGRLWLTDAAGAVLDTLTSSTPSLTAALFGERPVRIGSPADAGLDRDNSGYFDDIEEDIPIQVQAASSVRIIAYATVPADSTQLGLVDTTFAALPGSQIVRLALPGTDFVLHGVDGPYNMHAEIQAAGSPPDVAEHTSRPYLLSEFDGPAVFRLGPAGYTGAVDSDRDGRVDALSWALQVYCLRPGVYQTRAVLADRYGTPIVSAVGEDTLATGFAHVDLLFPGAPIGDLGLDPRYVIGLQTLTNSGVLCMAGDDFETNVPVDHTLFDPTVSPFVRLGSVFTSGAVDTNGDGRFDALHVSVSGTNVRPDTARIAVDALLFGAGGQFVTTGHGATVVGPGAAVPLDLRFDGRAVQVAGADGPYAVSQMTVASDRDSLGFFGREVYLAQAHTTAHYAAFQFAPAPHVVGLVEDDGVPVADAAIRMTVAGLPALADSGGQYHLGTPDLLPGSYTVSLGLPAGHDATGWRVLKDGQQIAVGRSAVVTFDSTETIRLDFVRGQALSVPAEPMAGTLLKVWQPVPNPVRGGAPIRFPYALARAATLELSMFDIHGRRVGGPLVQAGAPGTGAIEWFGGAGRNTRLAPGVYLARIVARAADGASVTWRGRLVVLN
jgi:hypothetical protein